MDDFCWSPPASFSDPQQCGKQYAYAVFWALQVTAGIGQDIIPRTLTELVFTCVMIVIGVLMYASIIGSVGSSLAALNQVESAHTHKMESVNAYLKYQGVPNYLTRIIRDYYSYSFRSRYAPDVASDLPESLKLRLSVASNLELIKRVPLFANCSTVCVIKIIQKLRALIVLPGEYIVMVGEHGEEMFLIKHGSVQVFLPKSRNVHVEVVLSVLSDGTFFGELALLHRQRRNASVRSLQYCHLMVLEKRGLEMICKEFPDLRKQIEGVAATRQKMNLARYAKLKAAGMMRDGAQRANRRHGAPVLQTQTSRSTKMGIGDHIHRMTDSIGDRFRSLRRARGKPQAGIRSDLTEGARPGGS